MTKNPSFVCEEAGPGSYTFVLAGSDLLPGLTQPITFTMTLDGLVDCVDPNAPTVTPTSPPPPEPTFTPTPDDEPSEPTVIDVTGTLICDEPDSPFVADIAPLELTISYDGNEWSFSWTTRGFDEDGMRWSDINGAEVGSYREQVEIEIQRQGEPPEFGVRFLHERGRSFTGTRVDIYGLRERLEVNVRGTSVDGGPFRFEAEEYEDLFAFSPTQMSDGLGLTTAGVILPEGATVQAVQAGMRIFTFADAGLHECQLRLERDDVPPEFQDAFGALATDQPLQQRFIWKIGTRFD